MATSIGVCLVGKCVFLCLELDRHCSKFAEHFSEPFAMLAEIDEGRTVCG